MRNLVTYHFPAAHCILQRNTDVALQPRDVRALFGAFDLSRSYETGRVALSPEKFIIHEDWNPYMESNYADLSLLVFGEGNVHFTPICLWESETKPVTTEAVILGWRRRGNPVSSLESKVIQINKKCPILKKELDDLSSRHMPCVGLRNRSNVCFGENGGSVAIQTGGISYLTGITTSLGNDCYDSKIVIYTKLSSFRDWIERNTQFPLSTTGEPCM